jgi:LmbE family N-acetylglucosaminyl deacetylase
MGGDCNIAATTENAVAIARIIREFKPDVVLAPHPGDNQHPDHIAVSKLVRDAARLARYGGLKQLLGLATHQIGSLYFYAITQVFVEPPELVIDVSGVFAEWQEAIACHGSQMKTRAYPALVTARARTWGAAIGVEYAVGLWLNDPIRVASLSDLPLSSRYF